MRLAFLALLTAAAALTTDVRPAAAQHNSPFCLINSGGRGSGIPDCSYRTLAQCRASISGGGMYCSENPNYGGPRPGPRTHGRGQYDYY